MTDEKPKKKTVEEQLREENVALHMKVSSLQTEVRLRDQEIAHLRKFKPERRDPQAADAFRRPFGRRR